MSDLASTEAPTWDERASVIRPRSPAFWLFVFLIALGALGTFGRVGQLLGETNFVSGQLTSNTGPALLAATLMIAWAAALRWIWRSRLLERFLELDPADYSTM